MFSGYPFRYAAALSCPWVSCGIIGSPRGQVNRSKMMPSSANLDTLFTTLVLAGDRGPNDPVAQATGAPCKALAPVGGKPMLLRILETLEASPSVGELVLSGPARTALSASRELQSGIDAARWRWREPCASPSESARDALGSIDPGLPVLLTTGDHALLSPQIVEYFCAGARDANADLAVGMVLYDDVMAAFPGMRRTGLRFRDANYCGCNLFAFMSPDARRAADFWRRIEQDRKKPWRMIGVLGWYALLRYASGRLTLDEALELLSKRIGVTIARVMLPYPQAAVDVDKPSDWEFVERLVRDEAETSG